MSFEKTDLCIFKCWSTVTVKQNGGFENKFTQKKPNWGQYEVYVQLLCCIELVVLNSKAVLMHWFTLQNLHVHQNFSNV